MPGPGRPLGVESGALRPDAGQARGAGAESHPAKVSVRQPAQGRHAPARAGLCACIRRCTARSCRRCTTTTSADGAVWSKSCQSLSPRSGPRLPPALSARVSGVPGRPGRRSACSWCGIRAISRVAGPLYRRRAGASPARPVRRSADAPGSRLRLAIAGDAPHGCPRSASGSSISPDGLGDSDLSCVTRISIGGEGRSVRQRKTHPIPL